MNIILTTVLLYISTSFQEWLVHKYMLHDDHIILLKISYLKYIKISTK